MSSFKVGDAVSHVKKPHRGIATITALMDGIATIKYPFKIPLVVPNVRVRDLKREEAA